MPDILIRGMEMPKTCVDCHDADLPTPIAWLGAKCPWAHGIIDPGVYDLRHERHPDCPLVELPEHGDLIDRDAFREENEYYLHREFINPKYEDTLDDLLKDAPVVIPSNKEDDE